MDIPSFHHERWDGKGYPTGLMGQEIPIAARIFAVVDVWDALTSNRPYRKAWPHKKALAYIINNSESHFDPQVVKIFSKMVEKSDVNLKGRKFS
jgi:HD-GYP domain-containing protein (c-di-GMP phosphodiesterase class II)